MKLLKILSVLPLTCAMIVPSLGAEASKDKKLKPYPLETCVVSGDKLGEMGKPVLYEYKDREIKFCCKDCIKDFKKDPAKYVKKLEDAEAKPKK